MAKLLSNSHMNNYSMLAQKLNFNASRTISPFCVHILTATRWTFHADSLPYSKQFIATSEQPTKLFKMLNTKLYRASFGLIMLLSDSVCWKQCQPHGGWKARLQQLLASFQLHWRCPQLTTAISGKAIPDTSQIHAFVRAPSLMLMIIMSLHTFANVLHNLFWLNNNIKYFIGSE